MVKMIEIVLGAVVCFWRYGLFYFSLSIPLYSVSLFSVSIRVSGSRFSQFLSQCGVSLNVCLSVAFLSISVSLSRFSQFLSRAMSIPLLLLSCRYLSFYVCVSLCSNIFCLFILLTSGALYVHVRIYVSPSRPPCTILRPSFPKLD